VSEYVCVCEQSVPHSEGMKEMPCAESVNTECD